MRKNGARNDRVPDPGPRRNRVTKRRVLITLLAVLLVLFGYGIITMF
ncbi:cell division protein FtsB [Halorubrum alkaliphilum]|uniref:Cell division protein FtsB n=1 Tax=Halorubrum alkaliphilum TaxID=261290 RepID=A0A8T4GFT4_9EURY|nr:hypothetical protein [Halorubrum alkaliphilum]MBP1922042.1 cell division protein FtsB [Halorubrum alkaliphilum]